MKLFVLNEVGLSKSEIADFLNLVNFNSMDLVYYSEIIQLYISELDKLGQYSLLTD